MILLHAASDTALALERKATDWKYITIRHQGAKKKLQAWFHKKEIYILNPITGTKHSLTLIIRQDKECTIKYSFCQCPEATLKDLAYRQSKRYFVEKAFREAKKELGLNEYQTRSEGSWNKHMAMVMLGQLFLNEEKIYHYEQSKLWLTTQDVIQSLKSLLGFVLRSLENLVIDILLKQPPDKRLIKRLLFLRI